MHLAARRACRGRCDRAKLMAKRRRIATRRRPSWRRLEPLCRGSNGALETPQFLWEQIVAAPNEIGAWAVRRWVRKLDCRAGRPGSR